MRNTKPAVYHTMIQNLAPTRNSRPLVLALFLSLVALAGCARNPTVGSISVPPIPEREARIWFYRLYTFRNSQHDQGIDEWRLRWVCAIGRRLLSRRSAGDLSHRGRELRQGF